MIQWCGVVHNTCTSIDDHKFILGVNLGWHRDNSCRDIHDEHELSQIDLKTDGR